MLRKATETIRPNAIPNATTCQLSMGDKLQTFLCLGKRVGHAGKSYRGQTHLSTSATSSSMHHG